MQRLQMVYVGLDHSAAIYIAASAFSIFDIGWHWMWKRFTHLLLKRYRNVNNKNNDNGSGAGHGQFIVGLISLVAIPIVFEVHTSMFIVREDIAVMLSRILISFAYALGGIYSLRIKKK